MSNGNKQRMIALICLALSLTACNSAHFAQQQTSVHQPSESDPLHAEILKYKTWTVVNSEPAKLDPVVVADCADVGNRPETPHNDKYISVYVNDIGQEAMLRALKPKFPVGTIVIKEKLPHKESQVPEFFTIMVKRAPGYNPRGGDWQYLIMGSAKAKVEQPSDIDNCQSCHSVWAKRSDFISRAYLSPEQYRQLR